MPTFGVSAALSVEHYGRQCSAERPAEGPKVGVQVFRVFRVFRAYGSGCSGCSGLMFRVFRVFRVFSVGF